MKAILCARYGGPDDFELADLPDPAAGETCPLAETAQSLKDFAARKVMGKIVLWV